MEAGLLIIGIGLAFYFIPTIIASGRSHPNTVAIFVLNLFLGWTAIGWIAALVWSFITPSNPVVVTVPTAAPAPVVPAVVPQVEDPVAVKIGQLERLAKLRSDGALSDQEYEQEKRRLLG